MMMKILLSFLLVTVVASLPALYTSIFEFQTSAGAHGTFNITIVDGIGYYAWALDLNSFVIPAEAASLGCTKAIIGANGLKFHVHQTWVNNTKSSTVCAPCLGHYDPFLACGPKSQSAADLCPLINRTVAQKYNYDNGCNPAAYSSGALMNCEVGDLSGKFGLMQPLFPTDFIFTGSISGDPNPPIAANYGASDPGSVVSKPWQSIMLHCPVTGNPPIMCAKLTPMPHIVPKIPAPSNHTSALAKSVAGAYQANFTQPGMNGVFKMTIDSTGVGYYHWNFNISGLNFTAAQRTNIRALGLKYHIHANWASTDLSATFGSCPAIAGEHYDPFLACSSKSQFAKTLCGQLHRNASYGYTYGCQPSVYSLGYLATCEIGDLSGKNGLMLPTAGQAGFVFSGSYLVDPNPPIVFNYNNINQLSKTWHAVMFHSPVAPFEPIFCARLNMVQVVTSKSFTGTFDARNSAGAHGTFEMTVADGVGAYTWALDLNSFTIPAAAASAGCTKEIIGAQGLKYHIHQTWANTTTSSTSCESCLGHYDPFLACSPKSQNNNDLCPLIGRVESLGYTYGCDPTAYSSGALMDCEVGDLSGKFGLMQPLFPTDFIFTGSISGDPNPPIVANYGMSDLISKPWKSIMLHCPVTGNPPIMCAKLVPTTTTQIGQIKSNQSTLASNIAGNFQADFTAPGTTGHFGMTVNSTGVGFYNWNFNISGLNLTASEKASIQSLGLKYHIHATWTSSASSATFSSCAAIAGEHYDPFLACSSKSQFAKTLCGELRRNTSYGYTYQCNPEIYEIGGDLSQCEIGDLSGKNGLMKVARGSTGLAFVGSFSNDPNPPITFNYGNINQLSETWHAVMLHLPTAPFAPIYCARLNNLNQVSNSNSNQLSSGVVAAIVIGSLVCLLILIGLIILCISKLLKSRDEEKNVPPSVKNPVTPADNSNSQFSANSTEPVVGAKPDKSEEVFRNLGPDASPLAVGDHPSDFTYSEGQIGARSSEATPGAMPRSGSRFEQSLRSLFQKK